MPLDTRLALGFNAPKIKSPQDSLREQMAIRSDEQALAANDVRLKAAQQGLKDKEREDKSIEVLSGLMAEHGDNSEAIKTGLSKAGYGDRALKFDEWDRAKRAAGIAAEKAQIDLAREKGKKSASVINAALQARTPEAAERAIGSLIADGVLKGAEAAEILAMPKDEKFWQLAQQRRDEFVDYDKQIEAYGKTRDEDRKSILFPIEKAGKELDNTKKRQETTGTKPIQPYEQGQLDRAEADRKSREAQGAANRATQERGQNMTAKAAANRLEAAAGGGDGNTDELANMVANYNTPLSTAMARMNPAARAQLAKRVREINPQYDGTMFAARNKTAQDFSPAGQSGKALTAADTALAHLATVEELGTALKNGDIQRLNQLANFLGAEVGQDPKMNFQTAVRMVAPEITKAVVGGQTAQADRKEMEEGFSPNASPDQTLGAVKTAARLLAERVKKQRNSYKSQMGKDLAWNLSPESQAVLKRYESGASAAPKKGDVVDGYTFFGGNPADKKNWKR